MGGGRRNGRAVSGKRTVPLDRYDLGNWWCSGRRVVVTVVMLVMTVIFCDESDAAGGDGVGFGGGNVCLGSLW